MKQNFDPPSPDEIRAEEARMLRDRATGSARSVFVLIALISLSLASVQLYREALAWACLASGMVGITIFYARARDHSADSPAQVDRYLRGHVVVSAMTGAVWGIGALSLASPASELRTFLAGLFLTSISAGGVMAGTVYRPGYLALSLVSLLPFSLYLLVAMDGVQRIYGGFLLFFVYFCFATNKTASEKTRDALAARLTSLKAEKALEAFAAAAMEHRTTRRSVQAIQHDMAQPLLALRNFLAELERTATSRAHATLVRQIRLALISQQALVEELSNVDQSQTVRRDLNVGGLLAQLQDEYGPQFAAAGCQLVIRSDLETIVSDRAKLERILRNFLSNAVKYGSDGDEVALTVRADGEFSAWSVTDHGAGMTAQQLAAFRQGQDQAGSDTGSGVGLSITRQLAADLGGTVQVTSAPGQGTRAVLRLPLPAAEAPAPALRASVLCVGQTDLPGLGPWSDLLSFWGWEFAHAATCAEAQTLITLLGQAPDLIVLDLPEGQACPASDMANLAEQAPTLHLLRSQTQTAPPSGQTALNLPESAEDLRRALEAQLQNNASSLAR